MRALIYNTFTHTHARTRTHTCMHAQVWHVAEGRLNATTMEQFKADTKTAGELAVEDAQEKLKEQHL